MVTCGLTGTSPSFILLLISFCRTSLNEESPMVYYPEIPIFMLFLESLVILDI
jgi:hypothetical protein